MATQELNTTLLIERVMRIGTLAKSAKVMIDTEETADAFTLMSIIQDEVDFIDDQLTIAREGGAA
jgi:hypothetical protein